MNIGRYFFLDFYGWELVMVMEKNSDANVLIQLLNSILLIHQPSGPRALMICLYSG